MHKISKQSIQNIAAEIVELCMHSEGTEILEKARKLYEMSVIFQHNSPIESIIDTETFVEKQEIIQTEIVYKEETIQPETEKIISETAKSNTSVEERIKQIMDNASKQELPAVAEISIPEIPKPIAETKKQLPQIGHDDEMKTSVSAEFAADMFIRVEKNVAPKKSLNDSLSHAQIQIGLNDRIAFVKHLFDGNLADFNRVLSQLNSFETEIQAKDFLTNIVKSDYDWKEKLEYEQRFISLIERKFL